MALEIENPFTHYVFIDNHPARLDDLAGLRDEFGASRQIEILSGDANEELEQLLSRGIDWRRRRGVVFLDPFGMQVRWTTIEGLARTKGLEVIVNFRFTCDQQTAFDLGRDSANVAGAFGCDLRFG